jgi:hypothetical protein
VQNNQVNVQLGGTNNSSQLINRSGNQSTGSHNLNLSLG